MNGVRFEFSPGTVPAIQDTLIVPLATRPKPAMQMLAKVDEISGGAASELIDLQAVGSEPGSIGHTTRGSAPRRVVLVGLGEAKKVDLGVIRRAASAAARWLIDQKIRSATLWIDGLLGGLVERPVSSWAAAMAHAGFRFTELRKPDENGLAKIKITLRSSDPAYIVGKMDHIRDALKVADAVNYVREVSHRPPNLMSPRNLAEEARRLAGRYKLRLTVIDAKRAASMNMGGLLAVGGGAAHAPCMIVLEHRGAARARTNIALVGKAVTFDTGGYSIKPAQGMETMKFDKCGGVTVMGVLAAAASLKLKCNLTGIIAAAENAISERAYRPSDILRMASGKTVEVTNTDAEGRLVLGDALWYAQKHSKATTIIDLATLTGGVLVALGRAAAGLMSNNDELSAALEECGRRTDERVWRLPLWDEYRELIRGRDSDIKNSSNKRHAHPIVGGMFLKEFVDDSVPWAHLDIAGTATDDDERATGWGVRLLIDYLRRGK